MEEYFQVFRLFFISLRIKKLLFMKRLGVECGLEQVMDFQEKDRRLKITCDRSFSNEPGFKGFLKHLSLHLLFYFQIRVSNFL